MATLIWWAGNYRGQNRLYLLPYRFDTTGNQGGSVEVDAGTDNITVIKLTSVADLPPNTRIDYYMSNNGGDQCFQVYLIASSLSQQLAVICVGK